jgi:SAM-dependent methyltransferase
MWDARYSSDEYLYGKEPNEFLVSVASLIASGGSVLCLADGEGRNGVFLAGLGFAVTSIDQSERGVDKARSFAQDSGVDLDAQVGDLATADLGEERWDAIVSIFVHVPGDMRRDLHARVVRALKPNGLFVLEAYTPDQVGRGTGGPPVAELTMTLEGVRAELVGLDEEHGVELVRPVVEGSGHSGDGAVVQFIGRRPSTGAVSG